MDELFLRDLHETLIHLYDPDRLRHSPLSVRMSAANQSDKPARLQTLLINAIEGLKPKPGVPSQSRSWRMYDLLNFCYLQQLSQDAAANQLGISSRHLRRERQAALETLAFFLLEHYSEDFSSLEEEQMANFQDGESTPAAIDELAWISDKQPGAPVEFKKALSEVLKLSRHMAEKYKAQLEVEEFRKPPDIRMHPVVLNQVLLDLITTMIQRTSGGKIVLSIMETGGEVKVSVASQLPSRKMEAEFGKTKQMEFQNQLTNLSGCKVAVYEETNKVIAEVFLPAIKQISILVIDDNIDTLQMFSRFTEGTHYRLDGVGDLEEAMRYVEASPPQLILLDVMMPKVDGWHVLGQLRNHPTTSHIPVMISTILAQEDLAYSLGASGFIRKPVTRPDFLAALDRQFEQMARGPRSIV